MKNGNYMKSMKSLEREIEALEGVPVVVRHTGGRDVRSDKLRLPRYPYERARKGSSTVRELRDTRFRKVLPGYKVDVLDPSRKSVHGKTLLKTVRETHARNN
jgi:hypothetical protein